MRSLIAGVFIFILSVNFACANQQIRDVVFSNVSVKVEIADSDAKRAQGLMYRNSLDEGKGMLFVFDQESNYSFWMKNMKFPLDLIWINRDKEVVYIYNNFSPCIKNCPSVSPKIQAQYVLEVNAGFVERNHIRVGDRVGFI